MYFADNELTCKECGSQFLFTAGEQAFYQEKGFTDKPRRCPPCRSRRRQQAIEARRNLTIPVRPLLKTLFKGLPFDSN